MMEEAFVPVDLDKLLNEFEEQDSIASSACNQQSSSTVNEINSKVINSKGLLTANMHLSGSIISGEDPAPNTTLVDESSLDKDLLPNNTQSNDEGNDDQCKNKSNHKSNSMIKSPPMLASSDNHTGETKVTNSGPCAGSSNEQQRIASKDNIKIKQESHTESIQSLPSFLIDKDDETRLKENVKENNELGVDVSEQGNTTSSVLGDCYEADARSVENNQMIDDVIVLDNDDTTCEDRTLNEETNYNVPSNVHSNVPNSNVPNSNVPSNVPSVSSNMPSTRTNENSSLFFTQDHYTTIDLREQIIDNSTSSILEAERSNALSNNETGGSNDQTYGIIEHAAVPVAQESVAEVSLPLRNNLDTMVPEESFQLGHSPPQWVPDSAVNRCVGCHCKFTMVKRRHHCRACGQVFCSSCCNLKFNLQYLEDKLARVCQACANILLQRQATLANHDASLTSNGDSAMFVCHSPEQQAAAGSHPVQPVTANSGTTAQDDQSLNFESAHIGNAATSYDVSSVAALSGVAVQAIADDSSQTPHCGTTRCTSSSSVSSADVPVTSTVPLPPLIRKTAEGLKVDNAPNHQDLLYLLKKKKETATFLLNKNLIVKVKIVKLSCCVKRKCWCFSSEGMGAADQEDMVILLECLPKESCIPQDVLSHFNTAFAYAKQGHRVTDLGYTIFGQPFLGSLKNAGFLYIKSSFQCLENLILPPGPHIFGILIQREEVSWVQLFPIRLILRLGAEYRYYPCPLWSVRDRPPLYAEVGHTIMDLLADFKNFQYTLPRVTGMHVHLEDKKTVIQLPQNRYDEVVKVLNATDEYVMAFEATFSNVADSHLVCIQDSGVYKTQAINIEGQERKVTGASFIVFNGALKTTSDLKAKVSIVEDGVMIQMLMQLSQEMRQAMREMRDFTIETGSGGDVGAIQEVVLEWVTKTNPENESILSPIDGVALGTTSDIKINTHFDYSTPSVFRLRWSQLFFVGHTGERPRNLSAHFKQTTAEVARACTVALRPYLVPLVEMGKRRIGLRVNLSAEVVGYTIGSQGTSLPEEMTNELDNELVPAIHSAVNPSSEVPSSMEFVFNIVEMLS